MNIKTFFLFYFPFIFLCAAFTVKAEESIASLLKKYNETFEKNYLNLEPQNLSELDCAILKKKEAKILEFFNETKETISLLEETRDLAKVPIPTDSYTLLQRHSQAGHTIMTLRAAMKEKKPPCIDILKIKRKKIN